MHDLLGWLVEERIRWWEAYLKWSGTTGKGAGIGDDWINIPFITPAMFDDFLLPCYQRLKEYHGGLGYVHSCGNKVPVQKRLVELDINSHEVNHWTDLDATLANVPPNKFLCVNLLNLDVLLTSDQQKETQLREIFTKCAGREFQVVGSAIEKVHEDMAEDIRQTQRWVEIAKTIFGRN